MSIASIESLAAYLERQPERVDRELSRLLAAGLGGASATRRGDALQPRRRRQAACGRCSTLAAAEAVAPADPQARCRGASRGMRDRVHSHLLAHSRRPAGDGQRHAASWPADVARRVRRRNGDSRRRRAADRSVRAAGARAGVGDAAIVGAQAAHDCGHRRRRRRRGMVGGQAIDLRAAGQCRTAPALDARRRSAARNACPQDRRDHPGGGHRRRDHGRRKRGPHRGGARTTPTEIGLAFQIVDDILDVEGGDGALGKTAGKDAAAGKPTYPSLFGSRRISPPRGRRLRARARRARSGRARGAASRDCRLDRRPPALTARDQRDPGQPDRRSRPPRLDWMRCSRARTGGVARARPGAGAGRTGARRWSRGDQGGHTGGPLPPRSRLDARSSLRRTWRRQAGARPGRVRH